MNLFLIARLNKPSDEETMRSFARRVLIWPVLVLSFLLAGRLLFGRDLRLPHSTLVVQDDGVPIPPGSGQANTQQDAMPQGPPSYAAGMYMAGRQPDNGSACKWYHSLPEVLSYPPSRLTWSPEIGEKSPYRYRNYIVRERSD